MRAVIAIAIKDLRLLLRDRSSAFFTLVFPVAVAIFFGIIFRGSGAGNDLKIAVVDEAKSDASRALIEEIRASDGIKVIDAAERADAETHVRKGNVVACVVIPASFTDAIDGLFGGSGITLELTVDPRHKGEAGLLTGKLNELAFKQLFSSFTDPAKRASSLFKARAALALAPGLKDDERQAYREALDKIASASSPAQPAASPAPPEPDTPAPAGGGFRPVNVVTHELAAASGGPTNSFEVSFAQGVVWGLMGCVTAFGVSLAEERARGTLTRLTIAPIGRTHVLAGKALACFVSCIGVQLLLLAVMTIFFGMPIKDPFILALAMVFSALGFVGVMMLMAGLSRSEGGAAGMGRAAILVLAMIGGGTIPVHFMPPFMKNVSMISPFSWATVAIEGGLWRQLSLTEMMMPLLVLLLFGVVGFVAGAMAFRWARS